MNLDDRELATVLAALRHWQRIEWRDQSEFRQQFDDPSAPPTSGNEPLGAEEIDDLCERLNVDESANRWYVVTGRRLFDDEDSALNCEAPTEDDAVAQLKSDVLEDDDDDDHFVLNCVFSSDTEIKLERCQT